MGYPVNVPLVAGADVALLLGKKTALGVGGELTVGAYDMAFQFFTAQAGTGHLHASFIVAMWAFAVCSYSYLQKNRAVRAVIGLHYSYTT